MNVGSRVHIRSYPELREVCSYIYRIHWHRRMIQAPTFKLCAPTEHGEKSNADHDTTIKISKVPFCVSFGFIQVVHKVICLLVHCGGDPRCWKIYSSCQKSWPSTVVLSTVSESRQNSVNFQDHVHLQWWAWWRNKIPLGQITNPITVVRVPHSNQRSSLDLVYSGHPGGRDELL